MYELNKGKMIFPQPGFGVNEKVSVVLNDTGRMAQVLESGVYSFSMEMRTAAEERVVSYSTNYGYRPTLVIAFRIAGGNPGSNRIYFPPASMGKRLFQARYPGVDLALGVTNSTNHFKISNALTVVGTLSLILSFVAYWHILDLPEV